MQNPRSNYYLLPGKPERNITTSMEVILILGSPNKPDGELYDIAIDRCKRALSLYYSDPNRKIMATGGFGGHFNTSDKAHAALLMQYLQGFGIPTGQFLPWAESRNTIEDARMSLHLLESHPVSKLIIVTSDYHYDRAQYIFGEVHGTRWPMEFALCETDPEESALDLIALAAHEKRALKRLKEKGLNGYYPF